MRLSVFFLIFVDWMLISLYFLYVQYFGEFRRLQTFELTRI